jgi:hypothetical protein
LKNETSLVVVSMRRMRPNLSYSLSEQEANRCLMQGELLGQERCDLLGLDRQHRLASELLVQRVQDGVALEDQIGRVLRLHDAPVVALLEDIEDRAAQPGVAVEVPMQQLRIQRIGELLRALEVGDAHESVVGGCEVDALAQQPSRQPAVAVAVDLQPERAVRRHAHVDQPQLAVHPVEVVVQALGGVGAQEGAAAGLVVPRLVGRAGLHRRDHVHESRRVAACGQS